MTIFARHTLTEGERVHYRPLDEIQAALDEGYLELEMVLSGTTRHLVLRKTREGYLFSVTTAGETVHAPAVETYLVDLVQKEDIDLHAFRWYPHRAIQPEDAWLLETHALGTTLLTERINTLLGDSAFQHLLPQPVEISN